MTKPVIATAIMMLCEYGKLDLNNPASKFIPEFKTAEVVRYENGRDVGLEPVKRDVTVHDLLTHTAGFIYCGLKGIPQNQYAIIPTRHHH